MKAIEQYIQVMLFVFDNFAKRNLRFFPSVLNLAHGIHDMAHPLTLNDCPLIASNPHKLFLESVLREASSMNVKNN